MYTRYFGKRQRSFVMNKKLIGIILVIGGALGQIFFLSADYLGIGNDPSTVGWKQLLGAGVGLIVILVGAYLLATVKEPMTAKELIEEAEEEIDEEML